MTNISGPTITGDARIKSILNSMRRTAGRRSFTAGAANSAKALSKIIKSNVPSRYKGVRRSIGWRRLKLREARDGGAKVGGKTGRGAKAKQIARSPDQKGAGISSRNVHWWFLGTDVRATVNPARSTGEMAAQEDPVWQMAMANKSQLRKLFAEGAWKQIQKEIKKGKAFA